MTNGGIKSETENILLFNTFQSVLCSMCLEVLILCLEPDDQEPVEVDLCITHMSNKSLFYRHVSWWHKITE